MNATREPDRVLLSGRTLAVALIVIALLAFAVPPLLAVFLQRSRIARATEQLHAAVAAIDVECIKRVAAGGVPADIDVLAGPGDTIEQSNDRRWLTPKTASLLQCIRSGAVAPGPDPWLRPLLVNLAAARTGAAVWILSAGQNGIVETPFSPAPDLAGDDLGIVLIPGIAR